MLRPTPGDPWVVEQHHWNTGAKENQTLNPGRPSNRQKKLRSHNVDDKIWRKSFEVYDTDSPVGEVWQLTFISGIEISHMTRHSSKPNKLRNASWKLLHIKVTPDLHLTYSKSGGNLGLVLKIKKYSLSLNFNM